jgi:excisionase family DNA binding protein
MNYTVTPTQAAHLLGVTPTTVRRWIASGELDARKLGPRRWLIAVESVEALRLGTPAAPAPTAPVVDLAELAADIKVALGSLAIAASGVREARTGKSPNSPGVGHRRAELAIEHARNALRAALERLPPRSP